jgi:hypothetical protein
MGTYQEHANRPQGSDFGETAYAPPAWQQLVMRVADGSESMTWPLHEPDASLEGNAPARTKAEAVDMATRDLVNRLRAGRVAANFMYGSVSFNDRITENLAPRPLLDVAAGDDFDPTSGGIGGTQIWLGLDAAAKTIEGLQQRGGDVPLSSVVLVLSDGECSDRDKTLAAAKRLAALPGTSIAACLFATRGEPAHGADLLRSIVTEHKLYQTVFTAEQLRDFFEASVKIAARGSVTAGR